MKDTRFKPMRVTVKSAAMRDGEWTLTLSVPQEEGAAAAHLALFTGIVFMAQFTPEEVDEKEEPKL